jgi:hypothetical protein
VTEPTEAAVSAVRVLRAKVKSGDLALDPVVGEQLRQMLIDQINQVDGWLRRVQGLDRRPPLGQNPVAEAMAAKIAGRAGGDSGGSVSQALKPYRDVLKETYEAVGAAMKKYRATEEQAMQALKMAAGDL